MLLLFYSCCLQSIRGVIVYPPQNSFNGGSILPGLLLQPLVICLRNYYEVRLICCSTANFCLCDLYHLLSFHIAYRYFSALPFPNKIEPTEFGNRTSESLYGGQFTLSTQLIKPNYLVYSHRRSTTVSLETCPPSPKCLLFFCVCFHMC